MEVANFMRQRTDFPEVHPKSSKVSSIHPFSLQEHASNFEINSAYDITDSTKHEENRSGNSGCLKEQIHDQPAREKSPDRKSRFLEEVEKASFEEDEELDAFVDACDLLVDPSLVTQLQNRCR